MVTRIIAQIPKRITHHSIPDKNFINEMKNYLRMNQKVILFCEHIVPRILYCSWIKFSFQLNLFTHLKIQEERRLMKILICWRIYLFVVKILPLTSI